MADAYHHAVSSARKFGGHWNDYIALHYWFDETKASIPDFRHRALRHHSEGINLAIRTWGPTITREDGALIPTRWVAEQHVHEDCGFIPTAYQWLEHLHTQPWMLRGARRLSVELDLTQPGGQLQLDRALSAEVDRQQRTRHDEPVQPDDGPGAVR